MKEAIDDILPKEWREATKEERESVDNYIKSISVDTGVDFYDNTKKDIK